MKRNITMMNFKLIQAAFTLAEGATYVATCNNTRKIAFTLAEVIITIGIIGVVAGITIPTLVAHYKQKQFIVKMKKVYSEISQANQLLNVEYDGNWTNVCDDFDNKCFRDLFATKIKTIKKCDSPIVEGCLTESKTLDGTEHHDLNAIWPSLLTSSGYSIKFRFHFNGCRSKYAWGIIYKNLSCGWVQTDINGLKSPNVLGKDIFYFQFMSNGTVIGFGAKDNITELENGVKEDTITQMNFDEIEDICKNGSGQTCAAYYLAK